MTVTQPHLNRIATATPPHDVHQAFLDFAGKLLAGDSRASALFARMRDKSGIAHRYSFFAPAGPDGKDAIDADGFYKFGDFPNTAARMRCFQDWAPGLAQAAVEKLACDPAAITHLLITCCTGFYAPGLDLDLVTRCGLPGGVERTLISFMGCYAAINALKAARHIVRSEPAARVLIVNIELCTLHLKETSNLEEILSFLLFGDGCAASLVTAEPTGLSLDSFQALLVPDSAELITWNIGDFGFDMVLSGHVPSLLADALRARAGEILNGDPVSSIDAWAVHPGGRTILDAVQRGLELPPDALATSRAVLERYGNMSSATVMFVLRKMLDELQPGARGVAMAFGPGLIAETMRFHKS